MKKETKLTENLIRLIELAQSSFKPISACKECGDKLTLPDERKYGICRGCASEFIVRRYL